MMVRLTEMIKRIIFRSAIAVGRYVPFSERDRVCIQRESVAFLGDLPRSAGNELNQYRLVYETPRPEQEQVSDILYSCTGMAWWKGSLHQRFSVCAPAAKDILNRPSAKGALELSQATIIQVETPATYGDWVSEHLMCITRSLPLPAPLVLPKYLYEKSYVRRDLDFLGVEAIPADKPILIRKAYVLHKTRHSHYMTSAEIAAYRKAFKVSPVVPKVGSVLYLCRLGQKCEGFQRNYPSELAADVLKSLGAKVIFTNTATYSDYRALSDEAETVVADFGSALLNLMFWNSKNIIVLFTDDWWDGCSLFIAQALGISNIAMVRVNGVSREELYEKINYYLNRFNSKPIPAGTSSSVNGLTSSSD